MKIRSPRFWLRSRVVAALLLATPLFAMVACSGDDATVDGPCSGLLCPCSAPSDCPNIGEQCVDFVCVYDSGDAGADADVSTDIDTTDTTDVDVDEASGDDADVSTDIDTTETTDADATDADVTDGSGIPTSCVSGETLPCECSGVLEGVRLCNQAGSYTGCDCGEGPETGLCPESGCTSEEVELYLAEVLEAAGASLDDAASLTAIWSNPEELASVVSATLSAMAFPVSASGPGEKAACLFLAEYDPDVAYCGAGCSTDVLSLTTLPGDCLNRACFAHDRCYNNFECSVGSKVELECVFSSATSCCDDAMDVRADACEAGGSGRTGASLPVPGAVFAALVAGGSSVADAADAEAEATEARLAAFAEDVRFRTVRLMVAGMRASTRESCVGDLGRAATCREPEVRGTCEAPPGFVRIEPGTFTMGSPSGELGRGDGETQHTVTLTRAFLLQTTEVTQGQYETLMGANPSGFSGCGADCPVESVNWYDAVAYANALSVSEGLPECYDDAGEVVGGVTVYDCVGYRLPTESEWEYAARAGTTTATYLGDLEGDPYSCDAQPSLDSIAWFCGNAGDQTRAVGGKAPNAWGLYDMLGNVWEWTSDWYGDYPGTVTDPVGPSTGSFRVLRGGSWSFYAFFARAAGRDGYGPGNRFSYYGFRLARSVP